MEQLQKSEIKCLNQITKEEMDIVDQIYEEFKQQLEGTKGNNTCVCT